MARKKGQENQRYTEIMVDQFRREYVANCDKETGDPIDLTPYNWKAPISPEWLRGMLTPPIDDHDVMKIVPRSERNRKGYQIFIDHESWIAKNHALMEHWRTRFEEIARTGFKGQQLLDVLKDPPVELLRYMGAPPFPPVEFIQAMAAGNEWALGLSEVIPPKAMALIDSIKPAVISIRGVAPRSSATIVADPFSDGFVEVDEDDDERAPIPELDPFAAGGASLDPEFERRLDIEDQFDPHNEGGKRIPPRRGKQKVGAE